jgi:hypothetical protein
VAEASEPAGFGLPAAIALIMGSIIGVGIFNLPTSLAVYGPITLVSMALTTVGALALLFGSLSPTRRATAWLLRSQHGRWRHPRFVPRSKRLKWRPV